MLACLETLKTLAPFAYDSIKKSTDNIFAGTELQFFSVPLDAEKIAAFWNWFSNEEANLKNKLDKQEYDAVMASVGDQLLAAFPFLESRPAVTLGKNDHGYVIQLSDMYATGIMEAYEKLTSACPEDLASRWLFHIVH